MSNNVIFVSSKKNFVGLNPEPMMLCKKTVFFLLYSFFFEKRSTNDDGMVFYSHQFQFGNFYLTIFLFD